MEALVLGFFTIVTYCFMGIIKMFVMAATVLFGNGNRRG